MTQELTIPRYRCLEAIVKATFPNDNTSTAADLVHLGRRMGYSMPDIADQSRPTVKIEELVRQPHNTSQSPSNLAAPSHHSETPHPRIRSNSEEPNVSLVRDTAGNEHYIGPSGTLNFLSRLRKLVNENRVAAAGPSGAAFGAAANKFAQDDTAQALEADDAYEADAEEHGSPRMAVDSMPSDGTSPGSITSSIARDFTRLPVTNMDEILKQFPLDDKLELLISAYFKNVHDDFPLFHRATFEDEYEHFVVQARRRAQIARGRQRSAPDWGWIGCLHMMIVFGSIANPRIPGVDHNILRRRSVTVARALLPQFISKCTLTNVRVLLLLSLFLHNNNERNAAWNLVGAATRISFALGLHRSDMNSSFRPLEREVRKWVFCTLYAFEQFLASSLGRPSGLQEVDVEIVPPREGFLDGGSGTDAKLVSLSLKLQAILSKTRLIDVSRRKAELATPFVPSPTVDEVLLSLDEWKSNIAQMPGFDLPWIKDSGTGVPNVPGSVDLDELKASLAWKTRAQLRAVLLLHIQFHYIAIVATRPILLRDITLLRKSEAVPGAQKNCLSEYSERCVKNACQLAFIIVLLDSFDVINGLSGLDVFYAYCAAMVLILRLLRTPRDDSGGAPRQSNDPVAEVQAQTSIRALVSRVQDVINRADKGGSMKRFARVVDAFAECVNNPSPPRLRSMANNPGHPMTVPQQQHHVRFEDGQPYHNGPGGFEAMLSDQAQFGAAPSFGDPSMDSFLGLFPLSTFGSTGVNEGPVTQFSANEDGPIAGWLDMELLLGGGYGAQG